MQKDYRPCLEKLAGAPPKRKAALIRSLLPGIEAALNSGQSLKDISVASTTSRRRTSSHGFHKAVWRAERKRKPTAQAKLKQVGILARVPLASEAKVETVEGRDP